MDIALREGLLQPPYVEVARTDPRLRRQRRGGSRGLAGDKARADEAEGIDGVAGAEAPSRTEKVPDLLRHQSAVRHGMGLVTGRVAAPADRIGKRRPGIQILARKDDLGIHKTDLIQYLIGQKVSAVSAHLATLDKVDAEGKPVSVDDNAICIYEMDGGAMGTMVASWTYYGTEDNSTAIYGTEGNMVIYGAGLPQVVIWKRGGAMETYDPGSIQTNDNQIKSGIIDAFVDCLKNDTEPLISGEGVLAAMKAVFAAIKSSEEGRRIVID